MNRLFKKLVLFIVFVNGLFSISASDFFTKERIEVSIVYNTYPVFGKQRTLSLFDDFSPVVSIASHYELNHWLGIGISSGVSYYKSLEYSDLSMLKLSTVESPIFTNSMSLRCNILPIFIDNRDFRFNLFFRSKIGLIHLSNKNALIPAHKNYFEYGLYIGTSYLLSSRFGLFAEYGYGNYTNMHYGFMWNF